MQNNIFFIVLWTACVVATIIGAALAVRRPVGRYIGRVAVGVLFVVGGALLHVINLVRGDDYAGFADPAHFAWVTTAWRAVVPPNHVLLIGLLILFEATAGVLVISGRWTRLGYVAVIAFHLLLWLFGWFETVYALIMLPPLVLLLHAETRLNRHRDRPAVPSR
ncbi:DoxX family membrane protein [Lentzea nigeriaca]|uniref:DoxX family membrane protein n=1 Tax=Lentzea nigeriaca TaxID=1128665 RepID=UPI00195EE944|nr:DoxX family membrane protein [Lentzea nigeriaca]MBM7863738.1 putative membrane protein YphA (DoxX/SURF4 family) [Lentzea nigeriaca]